jgi:hypothetical protein
MGKIDHRNGGSLEWVANLEPPGNFAFTVVLGEVLIDNWSYHGECVKLTVSRGRNPCSLPVIIGIEDDIYGS